MKQTQQSLQELYIKDLQKKEFYNDKWHQKVRNIDHWKAITSQSDDTNVAGQNVYFWSDTHFGHKNIIRYSNRPFPDVQSMNNSMLANYKATVTKDDIVIFGGDISFMTDDMMNEILHQMPGHKVWIVGNHDMDRKGNLAKLHFNERHSCLVIDQPEFQLLVTHYPLSEVPEGCINVHGHIHDKLANPWNVNICVEHTNYAPMLLAQVVERAKQQLA